MLPIITACCRSGLEMYELLAARERVNRLVRRRMFYTPEVNQLVVFATTIVYDVQSWLEQPLDRGHLSLNPVTSRAAGHDSAAILPIPGKSIQVL